MSVTITPGAARELAIRAILACGGSQALAGSLAEATLSAELGGRAEMGFAHLCDYLDSLREGRIAGEAVPAITQPLPAALHCDAAGGIAQLGFDLAFERLVSAARTLGIAVFTLHNGYTAGELGYYARCLASEGLVALAVANSHAMMAPAPGTSAVYGTNPLSFAAPRAGGHPPLVIDQASSATAFVNLLRAAGEGSPIPPGWAIDAHGAPTTDAKEAVQGALLPFGGRKGANLALLVEVLAAGLSGGAWSGDAGHFQSGQCSPGTGLTVIAIAPLAGPDAFPERLDARLSGLAGQGVHIPGSGAGQAGAMLTLDQAVLDRIGACVEGLPHKVKLSD